MRIKPLLVFGLDGASFDLLEAFARQEPGSFLSQILSRGWTRELTSTLPYFTAPAWPSCMTGLDPSQHGLFHWRGRYDRTTHERPLVSSAHLSAATIWNWCSEHGGRVCVSNFPMEYPAPSVRGSYICGTLAPEAATNVAHPANLIDRIRRNRPSFRFEMNKGLSYIDRPHELRDHIFEVGEGHFDAFDAALATGKVDLCVHVVTVTDRMQHFFWHLFDTSHPRYDPSLRAELGNPILDVYARADKKLSALWKTGAWENLLVVSDHGMGPSFDSFHVDTWLQREGLSSFNAKGKVDVLASCAYSGEEPECGIYLNRKSRDGFGLSNENYMRTRDFIRASLLELTRPNGKSAFQEVIPAPDSFRVTGKFADRGPDLVLVPTEGLHPCPGQSPEVFSPSTRLVAGHRRTGVFMGWGSAFCAAAKGYSTASAYGIADVFPIACALMDLPIPQGLAGRVPEDLHHGMPAQRMSNECWPDRVGDEVTTQAFSDEIFNRLLELGYV